MVTRLYKYIQKENWKFWGGARSAGAQKKKNSDTKVKGRQLEMSKETTGSGSKPPCKYGNKCYRKNPTHFSQFSHPGRNRLTIKTAVE